MADDAITEQELLFAQFKSFSPDSAYSDAEVVHNFGIMSGDPNIM